MADWLKSIQSVGRGFRPGIEIKMISGASDVGKYVRMDFESDEFKPFRETFLPHYAEYRDFETGETYWKKFNRLPRSANLYRANNVIRKNEDGSYPNSSYGGGGANPRKPIVVRIGGWLS